MAAQPTTKKLFRLGMIVDGNALHDLMSLASRRAYDLQVVAVEPPQQQQQVVNGHSTPIKAREFIHNFAQAHEAFTAGEILAEAQENNIKRANMYTALTDAVKRHKILKRGRSPGEYHSLIHKNAKQLALPDHTKPPNGAKSTAASSLNGHGAVGDMTNNEFIVHLLKKADAPMSNKEIRAAFKTAKRNPRSVDPGLGKLRQQKIIKATGHGVHQLQA